MQAVYAQRDSAKGLVMSYEPRTCGSSRPASTAFSRAAAYWLSPAPAGRPQTNVLLIAGLRICPGISAGGLLVGSAVVVAADREEPCRCPPKGWWAGTALGARRSAPLADLRFFRTRHSRGATAIAVCAFAALGGFLFLNTLYLQDGRGLPALRAGLYTLPMAAMIVMCSPLSGRIVGAQRPRLPLIAAGIATTAGGITLARLAADTLVQYLIVSYIAFAIGTGLVNPRSPTTRCRACQRPDRNRRRDRLDEPASRLRPRRHRCGLALPTPATRVGDTITHRPSEGA